MAEDKARRDRRMKAYNATPAEVAKNTLRKAARRAAIKAGKVKVGDTKELDHKKMLSKGGTNTAGNVRVVERSKNRAHGTTKRPKGTSRFL
jgi:hypothetical protein